MSREFERFAWYDGQRQCVVLMSRLLGNSLQMVLEEHETVKSTYEFLERRLELGLYVQEMPKGTHINECSNCPRPIYIERGSVWVHVKLDMYEKNEVCMKPHPLTCRKANCKSGNCRGW